MNKSCAFKILYYISFFLFILICLGISSVYLDTRLAINLILGIANILLTIIFIIKSKSKKIEDVNITFPITYLIFLVIVVILMFVMNKKLIFPYIHFSYYKMIILFNYLLLNIYSVLSCFKSKNN